MAGTSGAQNSPYAGEDPEHGKRICRSHNASGNKGLVQLTRSFDLDHRYEDLNMLDGRGRFNPHRLF